MYRLRWGCMKERQGHGRNDPNTFDSLDDGNLPSNN